MKITITAVSVPALRQIQAFRKRYEQQYPEDDLTIVCFYVAGQEQRYVLEPERIIKDIATADVAVVDTMGASEELQEIVAKGLKACKGHRIVIGNALRDYIRLGSFSMGAMGKMMKGSGGKKDPGNVSGTSGTDSAEVSGTGEKKSSGILLRLQADIHQEAASARIRFPCRCSGYPASDAVLPSGLQEGSD